MDTKLKADIAECAVTHQLLKRGWRVLKPVGDRLPYDLAIDLGGRLVKIQVKSAWKRNGVFIVDNRRTKTNRRCMKRAPYSTGDFDFAVLYIDETNSFYILPFSDFCAFGSEITLRSGAAVRAPKSQYFLSRWDLIRVN